MKFRPCIDIHNGVVKQIVGSTLTEGGDDKPVENFVASLSSKEFSEMYKSDCLTGGHVIMLGPGCESAALDALAAYPQGLQVGGGINASNATKYLEAGASHIIVTSYVFHDGIIDMSRLNELVSLVGKDRIVIDLSCRKQPEDPQGPFYVVTNKWTKYTNYQVNADSLQELSQYCDEFLVHGVDVEGKQCGIDEELVTLLGAHCPLPLTYAGGVRSLEDCELVRRIGAGKVDITIGSALDIFGGGLPYKDVVDWHRRNQT